MKPRRNEVGYCIGNLLMLASKPKVKSTKEERHAKREARREKQREENIERAAKMHAVRLAWENDAPRSDRAPNDLSETEIHVGCSGWFYWHWRGNFYPAELQINRWFAHYSRHFKTVELNAPFYSWPTGLVEP
jgi:Protein of unknown function DUF72